MKTGAKRHYRERLTGIAHNLRRRPTKAEAKLWSLLRETITPRGYKFRRQQPIGRYIVDFACQNRKLIIEIDGLSHDGKAVYDAQREAYLAQEGYRILKLTDADVTVNPEVALASIMKLIVPPTTPHLNPLPQGERK